MPSTRRAAAKAEATDAVHEDDTATDAPAEQTPTEKPSGGALVELTVNLPEFTGPAAEETKAKAGKSKKKKGGKKTKANKSAPRADAVDRSTASSSDDKNSESEGGKDVLEDDDSVPASPASQAAAELLKDMPVDEVVVLGSAPSSPKQMQGQTGGEMFGAVPALSIAPLDLNAQQKPATPSPGDGNTRLANKNSSAGAENESQSATAKVELGQGQKTEKSKQELAISTAEPANNNKRSMVNGDSKKLDPKTRQPSKRTPNAKASTSLKPQIAKQKAEIIASGSSSAKRAAAKSETKRPAASRPSVVQRGGTRPSAAATTVAPRDRLSGPNGWSPKPGILRAPAETTATEDGKQRSSIMALHTPPPVAKSTKPATKSNFQLPGEAVTARLKAMREERLKTQQGEAEKRLPFKARPVAKSRPVEVRGTTASRARMSLVAEQKPENKTTGLNVANGATKRVSSIGAPAARTARPSMSSAAKSTATSTANKVGPAQSPAIKSIQPVRKPSLAARPSMSLAAKSTAALPANAANSSKARVSSSTAGKGPTSHRTNGKEVFNRGKIEIEEQERLLREKADAAKRARAEAAERGRIASREWAEKKRAATAAAKAQTQKATTGHAASASKDGVTAAGALLEQTSTPVVIAEVTI